MKNPTEDEILAFLSVADKWQFERQKQEAMDILRTRSSPALRIALGRRFEDARDLLIPAFSELADTDEPPSERDALLLGTRDLLILWYIQDYRRHHERESERMKYLTYLVLNDAGLSTLFKGMNIGTSY